MTISMSSASLPICMTMLGNLAHMLDKAQVFVDTRKCDPSALTLYRLAPDMLPFTRQIQIACDAAKNGIARIGGIEAPKFDDTETTLAELKARIGKTLDFLLVHVEKGHAVFQGTPALAHFNPLGTVHGGWFATLLDSALGCAVHTMMPPGRGYTTAELSVNIVRALTLKVPRVRAEGRVIHCGRQLATAEARLVGPDGTLYAHGTTTCLVFDLHHKPAGGATE